MKYRAFSESSDSDEDFEGADVVSSQLVGHTIHSVDFASETFRCLPVEVQHEILLQLKDTRKQNSWSHVHQMPQVFNLSKLLYHVFFIEYIFDSLEIFQKALDFSGFQMQRLLKRRHLQERLDEVVQEIGRKNHEHLDLKDGELAESRDLASDETTRYVLIKRALAKTSHPKTEKKKLLLPDPKKVEVKPQVLDVVDADVQLLGDEFTQEELLFIAGAGPSIKREKSSSPDVHRPNDAEGILISGTHQWIKQEQSTSDSDSDLEEVPLPENTKEIFLPGPDRSVQREKSSSSEEDSDLEEVPPTNTQKILFSIPIDKLQTCKQEEDIFADIFSPVEPSEPVQAPTVPIVTQMEISKSEDELIICPESEITQVEDSTILEPPSSTSVVNQDSPQVTHVADEEVSSEEEPLETPNHGIASTSHHTTADVEIKVTKEKQTTGERLQNEPVLIDEKRRAELNELNDLINAEQSILVQQHGRQERLGASITDQMYLEAQVLTS